MASSMAAMATRAGVGKLLLPRVFAQPLRVMSSHHTDDSKRPLSFIEKVVASCGRFACCTDP